MTRAKQVTPKCFAARDVYIDPLHCGSSVGYRIGLSRYKVLTMGVRLTDCHKQIVWEFDDDTENPAVEKFDAAIAMLQEARAIWIKELAAHKRRFGRKKKK